MTHEKYSLKRIKEEGATPKRAVAHKLGFFYRLFTPYISYLVINHTQLSANFFSLLALIIPAIASALFLSFHPKLILLGALFHQLGYLCDVLDGEIARLRKTDNMEGSYIDALNHFFNIPLIFISLSLGAYFSSGNLFYIFAAISLSLFSRGSGKYCMFYAIGRRREYQKRKLDHFQSNNTQIPEPEENQIINRLKIPWVYPNITLFILAGAIVNLKLPQMHILEFLIVFYAITYPILDIMESIRIYSTRRTQSMYDFLESNDNQR